MKSVNKILIIRFSSFGDIVQCMSCLKPLAVGLPASQIHWVVRSEFSELVGLCSEVDKVWPFDRKEGLLGLIKFGLQLRKQGFTKVYDAHSNLRSRVLSLILCPFAGRSSFVRRSKQRLKRILLFSFRKNLFSWPYKGMHSYLAPLESWIEAKPQNLGATWKFSTEQTQKVEGLLTDKINNFPIALVPSAAWEMKRWPLDYWKQLIKEMPERNFIILGGPADLFCQELEAIDDSRVINLAGKLSLIESCNLISKSSLVISADTGLLHVTDLLGIPGIALIGPTAFGFPSGEHIRTLETDLSCRPCSKDGRGNCSQDVYKKCMIDITPKLVVESAKSLSPGN